MDTLNIGNTILNLRKERNITQEKLATMIGISPGAVSKWENGKSTPDISILVPLARALNTSLDNLLSFKKELSEKDVIKIKEELAEIFLKVGYIEGEKKCIEYEKEYPNSLYLKLVISELIQMYSMMHDKPSEEFFKEKMKYSLGLLYEVVESENSKYVPRALFSIANIEMILENYEESEKAIKELQKSFVDPMVLYSAVLERQEKYEEAKILCKSMLVQYLNQGMAMMSIVSRIYAKEENYEKSKLYLEALNEIQNRFKVGLYSGAYSFCIFYYDKGEKEFASKWFKNYVEKITLEEYDYSNNPYFESLKLAVEVEGQKIIRKKLLQSLIYEERLKDLWGVPEYEEAIEILKKAISKI